jgi:hypothetical protein
MATIDESMQENEVDEHISRASWEISQKNAQIIELNRQILNLRVEKDLWKHCATELRGSFVPNTRDHPSIKEYNSCCEVYDPTNDYYEP